MNKINFKSDSAQTYYNDYINRVGKCISGLSVIDRNELMMEINSHIFEGISRDPDKNELEILVEVTSKLGVPEEFLKPLVARKKLDQAVRSFNPKHVFQAITLNLKNSMLYTVFALLYLFLLSFVGLIIAKIIFPSNTGLFIDNGSFRALGYINPTNGLTEVLGYWFIPISIIAAILFYTCITLLMKVSRKT
jgi:uncharacterized membrane protein